MSALHTTRALLRQHAACKEGYRKLVTHLGGAAAWPDDKHRRQVGADEGALA